MKRSQLDALWQEAEQQSRNEGVMYSRYHFAALVIANHPPQSFMTWQEGYEAGKQAEREACAKVCDDLPLPPDVARSDASIWEVATLDCAEAIRARGQA